MSALFFYGRARRLATLMVGCLAFGVYLVRAAAPVQFDVGMLKVLGLDPRVGEFFGNAARFTEGKQRVALSVNGSARGTFEALFNADGCLCFNRGLLDQANLVIPADRFKLGGASETAEAQCYDFVSAYPQTEIDLRPNSQQVSLLVSPDASRPLSVDLGVYQYGGTAGLFNYDVVAQSSQFSDRQSRYYSADTEAGFNAGDWIVRSRQSFTAQEAVNKFQNLYAYAQKSFVPYASTLQAGQINISDSTLPAAAITGVQWVPDEVLRGNHSEGATVEGIAQGPARVEVRQNGALIHTALVPAGPFKLQGIQLLSRTSDLDVRVVENAGGQQQFTIAAASLGQVAASAPGYSMAIGKIRTFDTPHMQSPMVVTGSGGWVVNRNSVLSAGVMLTDNNYRAAGVTLSTNLGRNTSLSLRNALSSAGQEGVRGGQISIGISTRLTEAVSASINYSRQSVGYRDLMETTTPYDGESNFNTRDEYGASLTWSNQTLGSLSSSYSVSKGFDGSQSDHLMLAWNKRFKYASVGLNLERSKNKRSGMGFGFDNRDGNTRNENALYLTVRAPLGQSRNVGSYLNKRNGRTRFGATYDDTRNDMAHYRLTADRDAQTKEQDFSAAVNLLPHFAQVDLGYSRNGTDSSSYDARIRGGVVVDHGGVTLSPYALTDTFGVAKVGELSGVKLDTPSGPVWTDPWGRAVVAQMNPFQNTRVEVQTKTLPRNVDIKNGLQNLSLGRGAVGKLDFPVETSRRVLLQAVDSQSEPVRKGAAVLDAKGQYVTSVVDGGQVFLSNDQLTQALSISFDGGKTCQLHYQLAAEADLNVYFETAKATCTER